MCMVSMIGVYGEEGECTLMGVKDRLSNEWVSWVGFGVKGLVGENC